MSPYVLMASLALVALETGPKVATSQGEPSTSLERALVERTCGALYTPWADDAAQQCFSEHLRVLRADFGRDLNKLQTADRRAMDVACRDLQRPERQDAYLDCLSGQLVAIDNRRHGQSGATRDRTVEASIAARLTPADETGRGRPSSWHRATIGGAIAASVIATAGLGFLAMRSRRTRRTCGTCGVDSAGADFCATCRREAVAAVRRDITERMQRARLRDEKPQKRGVASRVAPAVEGSVTETMAEKTV